MMMLGSLAVRSSIVVLSGLVLYAILRSRSAALRHVVLAVSMLAATVVGPLSMVGPRWTVVLPAALEGQATQPAQARTMTVTVEARRDLGSGLNATFVVGVFWGVGVAAGALVLLVGLCQVAWAARQARPFTGAPWDGIVDELSAAAGLRPRVAVLQTNTSHLLATYGVFRPRVLLPAHAHEWPEARLRAVLCHEIAHIRRRDWAAQMNGELLRMLYWFNPLVWIACARLRRSSEQACDDAVLRTGVAPRDYASHLVEVARLCRPSLGTWISATPMSSPSTLERRITAMLNGADRTAVSRRALALVCVFVLCVTFATAALRARQSGPAPLVGSVYDTTGAVIPGVNLTLDDGQQQKATATTDAAGHFEFAGIAPGSYVLEAALPGFRALRQKIDLKNAGDWDRAVTLQVGELSETIMVSAQRVSPPAPAASAERLRVGGNIRVPLKVRDVKPVYPESMRQAGREGVVPIEAVIGVDGTVVSTRVLSAEIHPDLVVAAIDAVRQWRFKPTLLNGAPVEVRMTVSVAFRLSD